LKDWGDDSRRSRSAPGEGARTAERKGFRIPDWKIDHLPISLIGTLFCADETYERVAGCMQIVGTPGGLQKGVGWAKKGAFGVGVIF